MSVVAARRVLTPKQATELVGQAVPDLPATVTGETYAHDADTGELVYAYLPVGPVADLRHAVFEMKMSATIRDYGTENVSRTFGYRPRRPRLSRENCGQNRSAAESPAAHVTLETWAERLAALFAEFHPVRAAADVATVSSAVLPDWRLGELWTSGVINKTSRLPYHRDRNNFPVWSAMPVLRRGVAGGHLHLPEYDATFACRDGWALFFAGYDLVHGVTPMRLTQADGYRYSVVFYALKGLKDCHTYAVETARARAKRTERERAMAARLAAGDRRIPGSAQ